MCEHLAVDTFGHGLVSMKESQVTVPIIGID